MEDIDNVGTDKRAVKRARVADLTVPETLKPIAVIVMDNIDYDDDEECGTIFYNETGEINEQTATLLATLRKRTHRDPARLVGVMRTITQAQKPTEKDFDYYKLFFKNDPVINPAFILAAWEGHASWRLINEREFNYMPAVIEGNVKVILADEGGSKPMEY